MFINHSLTCSKRELYTDLGNVLNSYAQIWESYEQVLDRRVGITVDNVCDIWDKKWGSKRLFACIWEIMAFIPIIAVAIYLCYILLQ